MSKKESNEPEELLNDPSPENTENEQTPEPKAANQESQASEKDKEIEAQKDKYLRLYAEFDNYKKRTSKEILEIRQTAARDVIISLLEVLDDIDRAEGHKTEEGASIELPEGIQLIFNKFKKILDQRGVKPIVSLHTDFDVEKDEAISEAPVQDENLKGKVIAEIQKGYTLNDRLIRFAKVVVGR